MYQRKFRNIFQSFAKLKKENKCFFFGECTHFQNKILQGEASHFRKLLCGITEAGGFLYKFVDCQRMSVF